jgi:hypothetical protein
MRRRKRSALIVLLITAFALLTATAGAERAQTGNLIVSLRGGISPRDLPRHAKAPVAVSLAGGVQTADETPLPRVNRLKLELGWRGRLDARGLPVCPQGRLRGTASYQAAERCGPSLVGSGHLSAKIFIPGQAPFPISANLLAFNGRTKVGRRAVLIHAYTSRPPVSFVIPFVVHRSDGAFKTVLVTTIRRAVGTWPHVASFHIDVGRSFMYDGTRHSYLNASCPVPQQFTAGFLSFARATYAFADGDELTAESVRGCRAR